MSLISIPYIFSAGNTIIASQHNSNFSTLANVINGGLDNTNLTGSAGITYANLSLTGSIQNADLAGSIADSKLLQITTVSKVSGAAITDLASLPSGAGVIPTANLPTHNQIFTASGTFVAPTGITTVYVSMIGGGGTGGASSNGNSGSGGGGGAGQCFINLPHTVTPGNSYTVTINGAAATTVFDTITVVAGSTGAAGSGASNGAGGKSGGMPGNGVTTTGGINLGSGATGVANIGGDGAGSPFGMAGVGGNNGAGGAAPSNTGAGGGGGGGNGASGPLAGGAGSSGIVILYY